MTKEIRSPNVEMLFVVRSLVSSFGFRHSSFGFENYSRSFPERQAVGSEFDSRDSFPAPQAPFGDEANEREQKHGRAMPQRHGPAFGNGCFAVRQTRGKRVESGQRDDFAAGLSRDRFEQGAIRFERTKFL